MTLMWITKFFVGFQLFYLALGESKMIARDLFPRQVDLSSSCAKSCYSVSTGNATAAGSCAQSDALCLCAREIFRDSVEHCWDTCTGDEKDSAEAWFSSHCQSASTNRNPLNSSVTINGTGPGNSSVSTNITFSTNISDTTHNHTFNSTHNSTSSGLNNTFAGNRTNAQNSPSASFKAPIYLVLLSIMTSLAL